MPILPSHLCVSDDFTIDKYSVVNVVETDIENSPTGVIPRLSLDSVKGDLVLIDSK